jgi:hypothetical protein
MRLPVCGPGLAGVHEGSYADYQAFHRPVVVISRDPVVECLPQPFDFVHPRLTRNRSPSTSCVLVYEAPVRVHQNSHTTRASAALTNPLHAVTGRRSPHKFLSPIGEKSHAHGYCFHSRFRLGFLDRVSLDVSFSYTVFYRTTFFGERVECSNPPLVTLVS